MFGKLNSYEVQNNGVKFSFEEGTGFIEFLNPYVVNVFSPLKYEEHLSKAIEHRNIEAVDFHVDKVENKVIIKSPKLTLEVKDNFKVNFLSPEGDMLCEDYEEGRNPFRRRGTVSLAEEEGIPVTKTEDSHKIEVLKKIFGDEKFYGLGDKTGHLNKRNYEYEMWNTDDPSPHVESHKALYKTIPFFTTLRDDFAYGIFFDNTFRSFFDFGKENSQYYYFAADDGNLDYYFILGPQINKVLERYTDLTGKTPLPQMWTLGYQQCRWSYAPESRVMNVAENFRKLDIPCDALYLDIDYMQGFRVFTFDKEKFKDPVNMTENLKKQGFKLVTIIDPGVKKDKGYKIYDEGLKNGYFVTDKDGIPYVNEVWPGESVYPDFSTQEVRNWWAENQKIMLDHGVAGIWNDMNEPASFKGPLPEDVQFGNDGKPTDHKEIHNVYGHLMSKATYEGIKKYSGKRPFVITRACYAGTQKYSTVWTGDNQSFWEHLRMSIPMLLNLGLSGIAFCGTDVGGFSFDCTGELLSRWVQVGCFTPLFRNHSAIYSRDQEPWAFDDETLNINRKYIKLRYKLLPYLYDLMKESEEKGLPIMRPLVLHYPEDKNVHELNDEFLFGENILVAPVLEQGKTFRAVYLPQGEWIDYWTGEVHKGCQVILKQAPLDTCPMYVKSGSIIPNYPDINYVGEKDIDELTLDIYPGSSEYSHYQDDGESFDYKEGKYNIYNFSMKQDNLLDISLYNQHQGYEKAYNAFKLIVHKKDVNKVLLDGTPIEFKELENKVEFAIKSSVKKVEIL